MQRLFLYITLKLLLVNSTICHAQQFLNGSFELVDIDCRPALSNSGFNAHVEYVRSIGNLEQGGGIGLLTEDCGTGPAADGEYYIRIGITGDFKVREIVSLEMTQPMLPGNAYELSFYLKAANRWGRTNRLEIGLSDSNNFGQFGEKIHTIRGSTDEWERVNFQFIAPVEGKYLTLKLKIGNLGKVFLDHFTILCPSSLELGPDTSYCEVKNIEIAPKGFYESYFWQDRSTTSTYLAQEPGIYSVEAQRDECIVRDTIIISEIERNCQCKFYVPNAFSPNFDGINDFLLPLTDCTILDYEFLLFDRWGALVFQSDDPTQGWDGTYRNQQLSNNGFVYQLRYRFSYQEELQYQSGEVVLMR